MYNAQTKQDIFVDKLLNKNNGSFLDIGAGTGGLPVYTTGFYSNTYFFEKHRNWNGIAIDYDKNWFDSVKDQRACKCICADLMSKNINDLLEQNNCPHNIDYISLDVDDAQWQVFNQLDWTKYKFKVLTLEHNLFQSFDNSPQNHTKEHKDKILKEYNYYRQILNSLGYKILWGNVCLDGYGPVEDWWVSEEIYNKYEDNKSEHIDCNEVHNENFIYCTL